MPPPTATGPVGMTGVLTTMPTGGADSTTSTAATFGDPDSSGDGITFIIDPDGGSLCFLCCDTWAQDCPEGEKCVAWANDGDDDWNSTRCSSVPDSPGQPGDPCTVEDFAASGRDDCDLGLMCWNVDPTTLEGTCVALCTGDESNPSCDDPGDGCLLANDGVLNLCLPLCDPLADDCGAGQVCVASADLFACVATTSGLGSAAGGPCEYLYDCQPGLSCESSALVGAPCDLGRAGCCTPYCDLSAPDPVADCIDPGQACVAWGGTAPPPDESLGVCLDPGA
ncbi:MAG: ribulose phosphate epimerase [Myxococcota bacterium]